MRKLFLVIGVFLIASGLQAQRYLDFVENKGQWDPSVQYKTSIPGGSIVLKKNGYRVLQYNVDDYNRITDRFHQKHEEVTPVNISGSLPQNQQAVIQANEEAGKIRAHAYEVQFLNANPNPEIVPEKVQAAFVNYFIGNDADKWAGNCKVYQAITYKNIYPNIDLRFYTSNERLKYDIIVHPGGNPEQVIFYFDGVDGLKINNAILQVKTSVGTIQELEPYTYQLKNAQRENIQTAYEVKGNFLRFKLQDKYDKTATLVIDPSVVFISYSGSKADNWGFTATYDGAGNFYAGGVVFSDGFPVSNGAFQTSYISNGRNSMMMDMGIMKFDATGKNLLYSTYIGGTEDDQPHSLVVDKSGNLIIAGRSSSANYPTRGAVPLYGTGGKFDIVLTKLNANGSALLGSVRIGGSGDDGVNIEPNYPQNMGTTSTRRNYGDDARSEVIVDQNNNILLASVTQSTNFPVSASAFQKTPGAKRADGRFQDGVVLKMDASLSSMYFCSFLGGNNDDAAFVLSLHPISGDIFVAGATASSDFPGDKSGAIASSNQGGVDGFVANIKSDGTAIQKSTYIGTSGSDVLFGIQFDKTGSPYITGTTTGIFPVKNSNFNTKNPLQSTGKHFIAKLMNDLSGYVFFTNFGNPTANIPSLSLTAFLVDRCQNMYVSGWGGTAIGKNYTIGSLSGFIVSKDAYKKNSDGADFYFFILSKNADSLVYATFFGQDAGYPDHVDGGTSRFDPNGTIYQSICSCGSNSGAGIRQSIVGTPGSWSPNRGNDNCNLLSVKLAFYSAGISSGIKSSINGRMNDTVGCVPMTVSFEDTIAKGKLYYWDFNGDNINDDTTNNPNSSFVFTQEGSYRVRLIAEDMNSCNERDTSIITVSARTDAVNPLDFTYSILGNCADRNYSFSNLASPPAGKTFTATSFEWDFGDGSAIVKRNNSAITHQFPADGTYIVKLKLTDPLYCNDGDYIEKTIRISSALTPSFKADTACLGTATNFIYTGTGGEQFVWNFGDGTAPLTTTGDATHKFSAPGAYTVTLQVTDNNSCDLIKTKSVVKTVLVSPFPVSSFNYSPRASNPNQIYSFTNNSTGAKSYHWDFGDSWMVATTRNDTTIKHTFNASGTYDVCLYAENDAGCIAKYCEPIVTVVNPLYDVPNAFTPNGDGVNDQIFVRGFGVAKMNWRIYNRWGALVFLSTNIYEGWDGKFNGKIQPQDVYHYTLEIELSDGQKSSKKGDITLLK